MKKLQGVLGLSITQAISASVVVWLWSVVMSNGEKWFGSATPPNPASWVAIPLIFIIVATLSAGAVLGYPLYLAFHQKNWPKAVRLLGLTLVWLAVIATILLFTLAK